MAFTKTQGCEGTTDGATVTNANAAAGDQWTSVTGSPVWTSTNPGHGTRAMKIPAGTTAHAGLWTFTGAATVNGQCTVTPEAFASTATTVFVRLRGGASVQAIRIIFDGTGHILVRDTNNATQATSTNTLSLNAPNGISFSCTPGSTTTSGAITVKIYIGSNVTNGTPTETITLTGKNFGSVGTVTEAALGQVIAPSPAIANYELDDMTCTDGTLPGATVVTASPAAFSTTTTATVTGRAIVHGSAAFSTTTTAAVTSRAIVHGTGAFLAQTVGAVTSRVIVHGSAALSATTTAAVTSRAIVHGTGAFSAVTTAAVTGRAIVHGTGSFAAQTVGAVTSRVIVHGAGALAAQTAASMTGRGIVHGTAVFTAQASAVLAAHTVVHGVATFTAQTTAALAAHATVHAAPAAFAAGTTASLAGVVQVVAAPAALTLTTAGAMAGHGVVHGTGAFLAETTATLIASTTSEPAHRRRATPTAARTGAATPRRRTITP